MHPIARSHGSENRVQHDLMFHLTIVKHTYIVDSFLYLYILSRRAKKNYRKRIQCYPAPRDIMYIHIHTERYNHSSAHVCKGKYIRMGNK